MPKKYKFISKKKKRINFFEMNDNFMNTEVINNALINIVSNRKFSLDGCYGVFEYKEDYIKLNLGKGSMVLCGRDFDICSFENKRISINGKIDSIEFCI